MNGLAQVIVPETYNASVDPLLLNSILMSLVWPGSKTSPSKNPIMSIPIALNSFPDEKMANAPLPKWFSSASVRLRVSSRSIPSGSPSSSVMMKGVKFVADSPGAISPNSTVLVEGSMFILPLVEDKTPMVPIASSEP